MANSERRYTDKKGNMFIPMNVEGGSWNENFMTTTKLTALGVSIFIAIALIAWLKGRYAGPSAYIIIMGSYLIAFQFVLRYIIFEERFYYKMYKELKESEITTPAMFWNIASIKESDDGAILTYADGKIGILVKLERDTITGKNKDFKEDHYDAISDFYKELTDRKYRFVQMNIMEQAGNDPRLSELDKLTHKNDNPNICKLMEKQIGYIKNITHRTLYESDYVLVYTNDMTRIDSIVNDTIESIYRIMDGAFIGFRIVQSRDIIEFIKEEYGVKYFNHTEATLSMFKSNTIMTKKPFEISEIEFSTGEVQNIGTKELNILNNITRGVADGTVDIDKVSIKESILSDNYSDNDKFEGVEFESLSEGFEAPEEHDKLRSIKRIAKKGKGLRVLKGKGFYGIRNKGNKEDFSSSENVGDFDLEIFDDHSEDTFMNLQDGIKGVNQHEDSKNIELFDKFKDDGEKIDF